MFFKYIALMHKASLFTMISYHDVLRMYGKDWFVFKVYYDPVLKGGEDLILKLRHFCFSNQTNNTAPNCIDFSFSLQLADDLQCFQP